MWFIVYNIYMCYIELHKVCMVLIHIHFDRIYSFKNDLFNNIHIVDEKLNNTT